MAYHARMIIHNPARNSVSLDELVSQSLLAKLRKGLRGYQEKLIRVYTLRSGKDEKTVIKQLAKDSPFSAQEALAFGLIDEVVGGD
jgi:ATP-dependent protease ClpP protease subunit